MLPLITAAFTASLSQDVPGEIVYLPEGVHAITPAVNGKAAKITVRVPKDRGVAIAAALQASLDARLKENVRPVIAFDHAKTGPAAAIPESFRYEEGKGVILKVDWTNSGKSAVSGRDFSYFSPAFLIGDNGEPAALPSRGEVGSLVNNPAFRDIPRIAASESGDAEKPLTPTMKTVLAALNIDPAHADAEPAAARRVTELVTAAEKLATIEATHKTAIDALTAERDGLKVKVEAAAKQRAEDLVKAAVLDGRIAPADEKTKGFWTKLVAAGDADAETALGALPKREDLSKQIIRASSAETPGNGGDHEFITKARALVAAKQAANEDEAMDMVAASEPETYDDYMSSLKPSKK